MSAFRKNFAARPVAAVLLTLSLGLLACNSDSGSGHLSDLEPAGGNLAPPLADPGQIPPLPDDTAPLGAPGRVASYQEIAYSYGSSIFDSSGNVIFAGNSIVLPSAPSGFAGVEYARYAFNTEGYKPAKVELGITAGTNSSAWVGFSDYGNNRWEWHGPVTGPQSFTPQATDYLNSTNQFFVLVLTFGGAVAQNDYVCVSYENEVNANFTITGTVTDENGDPIPGETLSTFPNLGTVYTNTQGQYLIAVTDPDSYTVTPGNLEYDYLPANELVDIIAADVSGVDFVGTRIDVRGHITLNGAGLPGVTVVLNPGGSTATTGAQGQFEFKDVADGNWTVTPNLATYTFDPPVGNVMVSGADENEVDFTATGGQPTYTISGRIFDSIDAGIAGVYVYLNPGYRQAITDAQGEYSFANLGEGTYTLDPTLGFATFTPTTRSVTISGANAVGADFLFTPPPPTFPISGHVFDTAVNNLRIPNVYVYATHTYGLTPLASTHTNDNGEFELPELPSGDYNLHVEKYDYNSLVSPVTISGAPLTGQVFGIAFNTGPTWKNFASAYIGDYCIQCHRPDAQTAVDPYLRDYDETKAAGVASNARIQADTMPPGGGNLEIYQEYFSLWRTAGFPLD